MAYLFVFALDTDVFPSWKAIIGDTIEAEEHKVDFHMGPTYRTLRWGSGRFGYIVVSARRDLVPVPVWGEGLPLFYTKGYLARQKAEELIGEPAKLVHIYFLGFFGNWMEFEHAGQRILVHSGTLRTLNSVDDLRLHIRSENVSLNGVIPTGVREEEWAKALRGDFKGTPTLVPYWELIEPYEWTYGCTPTAAAMVFSYWDSHNQGKNTSWGNLIWEYAWIEEPCVGIDLKHDPALVPNIIQVLRDNMGTNTN